MHAYAGSRRTAAKKKLALRSINHVVTVGDDKDNPAVFRFESTGHPDDDLEKAKEIAAEKGWSDLIDWDTGIEDRTEWD